MTSVRIALAVGLVLVAAALGVVLSSSPVSVAGTNAILASPAFVYASGDSHRCQPGGTVPTGTTAVRISASANIGPSVTLKVFSGSHPVTSGERDAGWGVDETVTVPVTRVLRTIPASTLCIAFGAAIEPFEIKGAQEPTTTAGGPIGESLGLRVEYLRPGHASWWSLASSVAHRMGLGHAPAGTWIVFLLIAIMLTVTALASRLILRELR